MPHAALASPRPGGLFYAPVCSAARIARPFSPSPLAGEGRGEGPARLRSRRFTSRRERPVRVASSFRLPNIAISAEREGESNGSARHFTIYLPSQRETNCAKPPARVNAWNVRGAIEPARHSPQLASSELAAGAEHAEVHSDQQLDLFRLIAPFDCSETFTAAGLTRNSSWLFCCSFASTCFVATLKNPLIDCTNQVDCPLKYRSDQIAYGLTINIQRVAWLEAF
jgi:hypothetical protein